VLAAITAVALPYAACVALYHAHPKRSRLAALRKDRRVRTALRVAAALAIAWALLLLTGRQGWELAVPILLGILAAAGVLNILAAPTIDQILAGVAAQFSNTIAIDGVDNDFDAWLPKVGLTYAWTDSLSTSFTYQRGYRAGGLSINTFRAALAPDGATQGDLEAAGVVNSFEPEFTHNYDLALRSRFLDNRLTVNANVFYIDYTDQQISVQLSSNPLDTLTENVGESELYGFEADVSALLADGLLVGGYFGYNSTEFTYAPEWTAGGYARYEWASGWFVNGRVRHQDESFTLVQNDPLAVNDSFTVLDLIAAYDADRWRAELFVNNALDEHYFTGNFGPTFNDVSIAGPPRVVGARASFRY